VERPDAIVIGSGIGGLTAAAALAKAGLRPLVLEHHFTPGGNAQTFRRRKMFDFDVGLHYIGGCEPRGLFPTVLDQLGIDGVEFLPMDPDGFDTIRLPDLTFRVPPGWDRYGERLRAAFPSERAAIDRYLEYAPWVLGAMRGQAGEPPALQRVLDRPWPELTLGSVFDALEMGAPLRHVLAAECGIYGVPPSKASLAMHMAVIDHYLHSGAYFIRGGSRALIDGFLRAIERGGGEVRLRSRVEQIIVEGGRAVGVRLAKGGELRAPLVISNADAKRTLLELVGEDYLSPATVQRLREYRMALPLFIIYLAMQVPPDELGLPNSNVYLMPGYTLEEDHETCCAGGIPERPFVLISIASLKDPKCTAIAPPGYTNLQLMTIAPALLTSWGAERSPAQGGRYRHTVDYETAKALLRERILQVVEEMMPGFIRNVVWEECATPLTQQRFTLSTGGTSYGLEHTPDQFQAKRLPHETEVSGLYLCGANGMFGHGIAGTMMSGFVSGQTAAAALASRSS
jgi:all-trans-retinol 13,14-reductase